MTVGVIDHRHRLAKGSIRSRSLQKAVPNSSPAANPYLAVTPFLQAFSSEVTLKQTLVAS